MNISPVAFQLGPFSVLGYEIGPLTVYWYGIIMALAVIIGTFLAYKEAVRQKVNPDHLINLILIGVPLGWIGARIYYVVFNWDYYGQNPQDIIAIWEGGLAIHGGMITAIVIGYIYTRVNKLNFPKIADITAPSFILGQSLGRWGNFFNQEAYGYPTDLPWAMFIAGEYRHPTFLYESLWNLGVFGFLLWFRRKSFIRSGDVFLSYIALYSVGRFVVEGFRTDSLMLGPLRAAQVMSVTLFVVATGLLYWNHKRKIGSQAKSQRKRK